jgi:hypothetical protein
MKTLKPIMLQLSVLWLMILMAPPQAVYGNFRIVVIPDTQNESQYAPAMFNAQTQWVVDNKSDIAFVAHVGDVVNTCTSSPQYVNADAAMDRLDGAGVPYGVSPGNHDQTNSGTCGSSSLYPTYFGTSRFSGKEYYGGGLDDYNHYFLFSAEGMDFIIIFLQYSPGTTQLNWAGTLLGTTYPNRRGIVVSHGILNTNDSWLYQAIYTALGGNPNLFLMLCGHMTSGTDGTAYRKETRSNMDPVHIMLSDYQDVSNGNGWLRILDFNTSADKIDVSTYSPYLNSTNDDAASFSPLSYDMTAALPGDFTSPADCDVDGSDLAALIANPARLDLTTFAGNFGENACP